MTAYRCEHCGEVCYSTGKPEHGLRCLYCGSGALKPDNEKGLPCGEVKTDCGAYSL